MSEDVLFQVGWVGQRLTQEVEQGTATSTFNQDGLAEIGYNFLPKTTKKIKWNNGIQILNIRPDSDQWEETNKASSLIAPASWLERISRKQWGRGGGGLRQSLRVSLSEETKVVEGIAYGENTGSKKVPEICRELLKSPAEY